MEGGKGGEGWLISCESHILTFTFSFSSLALPFTASAHLRGSRKSAGRHGAARVRMTNRNGVGAGVGKREGNGKGRKEGWRGWKGSQLPALFTLTYLLTLFPDHAYILAHVQTNTHRHDVSIGERGLMMVKPLPDYTGDK